jgi:hypothetical protein
MGKLIYSTIDSADGSVEDASGSFDWAAPDEQVLRFVNDLERPVGTYLYGRRMYQTMLYWETAHTVPGQPSSAREFAGIWQAASREDCVFDDARIGVERQDTDRTGLRSPHGPGPEVSHPP